MQFLYPRRVIVLIVATLAGSLPAAAQQLKTVRLEAMQVNVPAACKLKASKTRTETTATCQWTDTATWSIALT
ncbi:MAG: hypothetical protein IE927_10250 [Rhodobacterales bacterium]|nr:hypothetical protein [Rhodobacterales bacterium]